MRFRLDRLVALIFALAVLLAAPAGYAATIEEALEHFTADDLGETETGINEVAASGYPRAAAILEALQNDRLFYSASEKKVFIKDASDRTLDAVTGNRVDSPPADIDTINVNNRLRRAVDAALGGL